MFYPIRTSRSDRGKGEWRIKDRVFTAADFSILEECIKTSLKKSEKARERER